MLLKTLIRNLSQINSVIQFHNMSTSHKNFVENGKKIIGAALNYIDIVKARNIAPPKGPIIFLKPSSSYLTEGNEIIIPHIHTEVAHEVELGVIIQKTGKNIDKKDAMNYVAGYCLALDLTAQCHLRSARSNGEPWTVSKGFDGATPVSRFIEKKEIKDPHNLELWLTVNGCYKQKGNTKNMIFKIPELIEYISKCMTLEQNDLILTGTPDGAGVIKATDKISCGIQDIICMDFNVTKEEKC